MIDSNDWTKEERDAFIYVCEVASAADEATFPGILVPAYTEAVLGSVALEIFGE